MAVRRATTAAGRRRGSPVGRTWLGALGALAMAASLGWLAGPAGLAVGVGVAFAWWWLPGPYAVAVGHVAALPVIAAGPDPIAIAALETGALAILGAPAVRGADRIATVAVLALAGLGLGALVWHGWFAWAPRWHAVAAVIAAVAVASYGLHRYEVVALAIREEEREP